MQETIEVNECGNLKTDEVNILTPTTVTLYNSRIVFSWDFEAKEEDDNLGMDKWVLYKGVMAFRRESVTTCFYRYYSAQEKWGCIVENDSCCHSQHFNNEAEAKTLYDKITKWAFQD